MTTGSPQAFVTGGVRIDAVPLDEAVDLLLAPGSTHVVHLCNAYTVALASRDDAFLHTVNSGSLNLADGMPMVWIAKRLGFTEMRRRVYGPDLMAQVLDLGQALGTRHFLFGSTRQVLDSLQSEIGGRWPAAKIVGSIAPPFRPITDYELRDVLAEFDAAGSDIVWVGMGTPKQDELVARLAAIGSHSYVAIGAAFDFIAGTKQQAPRWMQHSGLEWLYRLATEPLRLWRRYLLGNTRFVIVNLRRRPKVMGQRVSRTR